MTLALSGTALAAVLASDYLALRWLWRLSQHCRDLQREVDYLRGRVNGQG